MAFRRRTFLASATAVLAAPAVLRRARADARPVTLKLQHALSSLSCVHANFLAPWARNIETQSQGRLRIDIFPAMELGGRPAQLFDQARDGFADIVWAMPSETPGRFPRIETFELPFVPSRRALVSSKALEDFSAAYLKEEFGEIHPLCFSCADRGILHARRPIETRAHMSGLRLDTGTRFAGEAVRALGGRAVSMPSAQLPFAIARRVVDGCIMPWDTVPALKLDELLKAHTDFAEYSLSSTTSVLAMNKASYARLTDDLRKIIDDNSGQVAAGMAGTMWDLKARAVADAVSEAGDVIVTLEPEAVAHWREATEPVIAAWRRQVKARAIDGDRLLAGAQSLLAKYASLPDPQPPAPPKPPPQPVEAKSSTAPPAKASPSVPAAKPVRASTAKESVANTTPLKTTPPRAAPPISAPTTHWWQFWRSAPAPPSATASAAPAPHFPPRQHWWQFWRTWPAPAPAPAASAPPPAPAPPRAAIVKPAPATSAPPPPRTLNIPL